MEGEERRCGMCYEERETIGHMWNGCSEMRERGKRKERGEILNEDGREIRWMKEIWNRRERIEKERRGIGKNVNFYSKCELLEENFNHLLQNLKWPRFLPTTTNFPGTLSIILLITFFQFHPTFHW
jgi:hypothetical protein